jgi:hypothetical protein
MRETQPHSPKHTFTNAWCASRPQVTYAACCKSAHDEQERMPGVLPWFSTVCMYNTSAASKAALNCCAYFEEAEYCTDESMSPHSWEKHVPSTRTPTQEFRAYLMLQGNSTILAHILWQTQPSRAHLYPAFWILAYVIIWLCRCEDTVVEGPFRRGACHSDAGYLHAANSHGQFLNH